MILLDYYMTIVKLLIIQCKVQDAAEKFVMPIIIVTLLMLTIQVMVIALIMTEIIVVEKLLLLGDAAGFENISYLTLLENPCQRLVL